MFARLFRRLHNQIIVPLMIGAVLVAIAATVIAVGVLSAPLEARVRSGLADTSGVAQSRFEQETERLRIFTKVVAESRDVQDAVRANDTMRIHQLMVPLKVNLGVDYLAVVTRKGKILLCIGEAHFAGEDVAATELFRLGTFEMNAADTLETGHGPSLAAVAPTRDSKGITSMVLVGRLIDTRFLEQLQDQPEVSLTLFDHHTRRLTASTLTGTAARRLLPRGKRARLALRAMRTNTTLENSFSFDGKDYFANYSPLTAGGQSIGVLEAIQPMTQVQVTRMQTAGLIAMWSLVAVIVLVGAGIVIARTVSRPIQALAESARTVAAGDLSPKISVRGYGEIAELTSSFNTMTAGLREQTSALTRRLVELYGLYDMSKALGTTLELDTLLNTVLDSALKVLRADSGYVMLVDHETNELVLKAQQSSEGDGQGPREVAESIARWVLQERKPLLFGEGKYEDVGFAPSESTPRSAICVPLKVKDSVIGVITISNCTTDAEFGDENVRLLSTLAANAAVAIENATLFKSLEEAYMGTVKALAAAIDAKDSYTQGHSSQVAYYALMLADALDLPDEDKKAIETAAYLHDIGKIGVRDEILVKPGRLSLNEMNEIRHHSMISANILAPVPFPWQITPIVRHHHERWDGSGYPAGLKGHEIPFLARALAIADAFDAMTSKRPYRKRKNLEEAIAELKRCAGTHFDPDLVGPFLQALEGGKLPATMPGGATKMVTPEQFDREEIRAIFVSLANGLMGNFRRLGGPRVAANVEEELNAQFDAKGYPLTFQQGYVAARWEGDRTLKEEIEIFRETLTAECRVMEMRVGNGIVTRFYLDVLDSMSTRFQVLAARFGLDGALATKTSS